MTSPRPRVLIVDDDEALCDLVELWLQKEYEVEKAPDGVAAYEAMKRSRPDVAIVDVMMPRMSGIELAGKMRSDPELRDVPLLFVSAYHAILEPHERESIRPWGLLSKPFPRDVLERRLAEILATRREAADS